MSRPATHAGTWYTSNPTTLNMQLNAWLQTRTTQVKALIAPHAGLHYSGKTAAVAYGTIQTNGIQRIFLLGPSHRAYTEKCELSGFSEYKTPLRNIKIDRQTVDKLAQNPKFRIMKHSVEEAEHSIELHTPFIAKIFDDSVKLIPILVGNLSTSAEKEYAEILLDDFDADDTLFIISSDFCHWGERFNYQYYNENDGEIWQSIEKLDRLGMKKIESKNPKEFTEYLQQTENTICGRHPIGVLINLIDLSSERENLKLQFIEYDQSNKVRNENDSSVSYAAAVVFKKNQNDRDEM